MKCPLQVGDRVVCISNQGYGRRVFDKEGVVCYVPNNFHPNMLISVRWDDDIGGHNCSGRCDFGHGWNISIDCLALINNIPKVNIDSLL